MFCYLLIAHTVYAYIVVVVSLQPTVAVEEIADLCGLASAEVAYVYNLDYTEINTQTCGGLSAGSEFYWVAGDSVVSDIAGLSLERVLAWADLIEAIVWLLILLTIEIVVRIQIMGVSAGMLISIGNALKVTLYLALTIRRRHTSELHSRRNLVFRLLL